MSSEARLIIRVRSARSHSIVQFSTKGRYVSFPVNSVTALLNPAAIPPTSSVPGFWLDRLAIVTAELQGMLPS